MWIASWSLVASVLQEWPDLTTVSQRPSELRALLARFANVSSVAVVGSSGNLLRRGYGPLIDAHDVVVRVNGAVTRGYEHDCGHRHHIVVGWYRGLQDAVERHVLGAQVFQQRVGAGGADALRCLQTHDEHDVHARRVRAAGTEVGIAQYRLAGHRVCKSVREEDPGLGEAR